MTQRGRDGIPAESDEVHAHARVDGHPDARDHVGVAGDQDHVGTVPLVRGLDHIRDQQGVDGLLRPALTPLDQLTGPQLHALDDAQCPLIAVWS